MLKEIIDRLSQIEAQGKLYKQKAQKYDDIKRLLDVVTIKVSNCVSSMGDDGKFDVTVEYSIPTQVIDFDEDVVRQNEVVRALNLLGLISADDMEKIAKQIVVAGRLNK